MSFVKEFREFAVKGNVVDLAVGVIIGAAFSKIVDSVVKDLIMPIVGRFIGGLDFSNYFIKLADPPPGYTGPMTYEALTKAGITVTNGEIASEGRTVINLQDKSIKYVIEGQTGHGYQRSGPLGVDRPRYWEVDGNMLTLTTRTDDGKALSVAKWRKMQ